jgi:hypothetical protein
MKSEKLGLKVIEEIISKEIPQIAKSRYSVAFIVLLLSEKSKKWRFFSYCSHLDLYFK